MTPFIGIAGRRRSGKDTAARHLATRGYARVAFADFVRDDLSAINPPVITCAGSGPLNQALTIHNGWEGAKECPQCGPQTRHLLQLHGSWARDTYGATYWVERALARVREIHAHGRAVVVCDVRYPNEAQAIVDAGGTLIRIVRPSMTYDAPADAHVSENGDFPVHATVSSDPFATYLARLDDALSHTTHR